MRGSLRRLAANVLRVDPTAFVSCVNLLYVTALTLVVITALSRYGFPTLSFAAVSGAAGIAVGLALKTSLSHFCSGVILFALRPFNSEDRIGAAGVSGEVIDIQVFATTISAEDGRRVIIPNGSITGGSITNHSVR